MSSEQDKEKMLELLSGRAFSDLSAAEMAQLEELEKLFPELERDDSFEIAASAVSLTNLDVSEPLPAHLQAKILADADKYFASQEAGVSAQAAAGEKEEYQKTFAFEPKRGASSWRQWLGWLVAAFACTVLAVNIWITRFQPRDIAGNPTPTPTVTPQKLTPAQEFAQLLDSVDTIQTTLTNPKNPNEVLGVVAWNDAAQKGFISLRGIPANDATKEQYQLWIFASNQDQKTPVDGGVFDVGAGGEVIIPIDAKIKVEKPTLFAVTAEKPGGVVVSKQEKILAIAKVQT
ncbi:MAG TPA: anti-sigma factor [Pyrinomonadaceae bacterium]|nr:anti-sigma factor [Pyrinomonadaceae bacterium]